MDLACQRAVRCRLVELQAEEIDSALAVVRAAMQKGGGQAGVEAELQRAREEGREGQRPALSLAMRDAGVARTPL